ncbi:hypothetical protein EUX98_g8440 [Antrodiella citrinella]|uniref:Uncharacterized protein n=1 Tax=Antrodiella citrinella TaxID=2447956 RepID=A0A4S4M9K7_9APHY|nr:hypothetical protein EUX98_g8440 [Antrodiella citrinella]
MEYESDGLEDDEDVSGWEEDADVSTRILLSQDEALEMGEEGKLEGDIENDEEEMSEMRMSPEMRIVSPDIEDADEEMSEMSHSDATEADLEHDRFELDAGKVRGRRRRTTCERIKDASESGSLREEVRVIIWQRMSHAKEYRKCLDMIFEKLKEIRALTTFSCSSVMPPGPTLRLEELRRFSTTLELLQLSNVAYLPRALSGFDGPIRLERLRKYVGPVTYMQQIDAPVLEQLFVSTTLQEVYSVEHVMNKLERIMTVEVLLTGGVESEFVVLEETDDVWMEATAFLLEMIGDYSGDASKEVMTLTVYVSSDLEVVERLPLVLRRVSKYMKRVNVVTVVTLKHEIRWKGKPGMNGVGWKLSVREEGMDVMQMRAMMKHGLGSADGEMSVPDE